MGAKEGKAKARMAIYEVLYSQPARADEPGEADGCMRLVEIAEGEDEPSEKEE